MSELSTPELEKVAEDYERLLAPALFTEWTHRMADAAEIQSGQHVLDVACGTGILAQTIATQVGPDGFVSGVDINPGMLAVARRTSPTIDWREGAAEALPYDDDTFDAVVCQFGLMLFSDSETALREMWRVLKPGGHLAVAVFDSLDNLPAYSAMADIFERLIGKDVGNALRLPFSMGDTNGLAALFTTAGIGTAKITTHKGVAHFASISNMVLADVRGWFPFAGLRMDEEMIEAVVNDAQKALKPYQTPSGAVEFQVPVHIVTAVKA